MKNHSRIVNVACQYCTLERTVLPKCLLTRQFDLFMPNIQGDVHKKKHMSVRPSVLPLHVHTQKETDRAKTSTGSDRHHSSSLETTKVSGLQFILEQALHVVCTMVYLSCTGKLLELLLLRSGSPPKQHISHVVVSVLLRSEWSCTYIRSTYTQIEPGKERRQTELA